MSKGVRLFVVALLFFGAEVSAAHAVPQWCEVLVAEKKSTRSRVDDSADFIAYLGKLLESRIIGTEELQKLQDSLERGTLVNPISEQDAQVHSRLLIHYEGLQDRIEQSQIDHAHVLNWVKERFTERNHARVHRDETREKTEDPYHRIEFHRIAPGAFKMGTNEKFVDVTLTDPFDLMSTLVTQRHWSMIMGENPSRFFEGAESIVMTINGNPVQMQPDHPVEQVSWNRAQEFIQKLNDLSIARDPLLSQLIRGYKKGDQYRLPTEAEWEFVAKNRGRASGQYICGDRHEDLKEYAWVERGGVGETCSVASLKPLVVDGNAFYDLQGNTYEWVQDWDGDLPYGERVTNPSGPKTGTRRVHRSCSWYDSFWNCTVAVRGSIEAKYGEFMPYGLRLVRVIQ